jgi:3-dehydroquinate synthase
LPPDYGQPLELVKGDFTVLSTELASPSPFIFGQGILDCLPQQLRLVLGDRPPDRIFLVSDPTVFRLYGRALQRSLQRVNADVHLVLLPAGERAKSFSELEALCEELMAKGATKRSVLVAFGGGSVGNVVGLAAGLLFRGVRFVEIPTSFTHLTDGTLSNKQAVNGRAGKNHFGMYHSPVMVWGDTAYLKSEPRRLRNAGIVEGIKNALIDQPDFIEYLCGVLEPEAPYSPSTVTELAYKIILSKLEILKKDPSETGYAIVLEYGHTFAHAFEWLSRGELIHGEAVGIGMQVAARLAARVGRIGPSLVRLHDEMINERLGMHTALPADATPHNILETMRVDNKKTGDSIRYCLLDGLGRCANPEGDFLVVVDDHTVASVLADFIAEMDGSKQVRLADTPGPVSRVG